jgi:hypothetical protein
MPSKPRSLAGILHRRRAADAEYDRARRDLVAAQVNRSSRWTAVRSQVLRDDSLCRACGAAGRTEPRTQVDHVVPVRVRPDLAYAPHEPPAPLHGLPRCHEHRGARRRSRGGRGAFHLSRLAARERRAGRVAFFTG